MIGYIVRLISLLSNLLILVVFIDVALSFFLSPYHPIRNALDRIVNPLLIPIRRVVPSLGMLDLSPLVLIILIELISYGLIRFLSLL
jgi:YggT family protein